MSSIRKYVLYKKKSASTHRSTCFFCIKKDLTFKYYMCKIEMITRVIFKAQLILKEEILESEIKEC